MRHLFLGLRATLFYAGFAVVTIWFSTTGFFLLGFLPFHIRGRYMTLWNFCVANWLKWTCGVSYQVIGKENLPDSPYIALSNHQSQWETYFLQGYLFPICFVLKQELLSKPFFGWGLRVLDPIAIDRSNPKQAIRQTTEQGKQRLSDKISVLIFPEGTRVRPGEKRKYARSGANLAIQNNVPIVPIAHNAGQYWPADTFIKYPGTITVFIGKPIWAEEKNSRELNEQAQQWIESKVLSLSSQTNPHSIQ